MSEKTTLDHLADAAGAKLNEAADRARAAGHEVAARVSDSPLDTASEKVKAGVDRAKAGVHNAEAHASYDEGSQEARDGDGH